MMLSSVQLEIDTGITAEVERANMHRILIGGDQLTVARARSAQKARLNVQTPSKRLQGLVSVLWGKYNEKYSVQLYNLL